MANHLFTFVLEIEGRKHDTQWTLNEIHRRIAHIRAEAVVVSHFIAAYFEQLTHGEFDDIITGLWFMKMRAPIDGQILLELDVLGAALDLPGCQTRLAFHVRDAIRDMGLANPWARESDGFTETS